MVCFPVLAFDSVLKGFDLSVKFFFFAKHSLTLLMAFDLSLEPLNFFVFFSFLFVLSGLDSDHTPMHQICISLVVPLVTLRIAILVSCRNGRGFGLLLGIISVYFAGALDGGERVS